MTVRTASSSIAAGLEASHDAYELLLLEEDEVGDVDEGAEEPSSACTSSGTFRSRMTGSAARRSSALTAPNSPMPLSIMNALNPIAPPRIIARSARGERAFSGTSPAMASR